jgi:putative SOS response-associated peptidase YedK
MINARSETVATLPAFASPFKFRRCLIPADAFYEWKRSGKAKQPWCFEINDSEVFAFAGIWDRWREHGGWALETCSILTTTPNTVAAEVHDRMPVIIDRDDYDVWLDPGMHNLATLSDLLRPFKAHGMHSYPVSVRLNNVANDDEECACRAEPDATASQPFLFS